MGELLPWPVFDIPDPLPADGTVLHAADGWRWVVINGEIAAEPTPGDVMDVEDRILTALRQAIAQIDQAYADWPTMTAGQKDATMRAMVRLVGRLCRLHVRDLRNEG